MSEPVYKRIEDLDPATLPIAAADKSPISQSGTTKMVREDNRYGAGWFAKLAAAFSAFVAPEATHAVNADTLGAGADTPADLHDAAQLTGALDLDRIPAELTGKNAATATDSSKVNGFSFASGSLPMGVIATWLAGQTWTPFRGLYIISRNGSSEAKMAIVCGGITYGNIEAGLYWFDGTQIRVVFTGSGNCNFISYKLV